MLHHKNIALKKMQHTHIAEAELLLKSRALNAWRLCCKERQARLNLLMQPS